MTITKYDIEDLGPDSVSDDGSMKASAEELQKAIIGKKIIAVEKRRLTPGEKTALVAAGMSPYPWFLGDDTTILTLSDQTLAVMVGQSDCCSYTEIDAFKLLDTDHAITGVGTTGEFNTWFIYTEDSVAATVDVSWSPGNAFYYAFGFTIVVIPLTITVLESAPRKVLDA